MDRKKFAEIMTDLANAFGELWMLSDSVLKTWYRYLSEFDERDLRKAVDHFILTWTKKPSLSELKGRCKKEKADRLHMENMDV